MAIAYYTKSGYVVSLPFSDNARYDIVVEKGGVFYKVQCKTSRRMIEGKYVVELRTSGGNKSGTTVKTISVIDADILFVYTFDGLWWEFPPEQFVGKTSITLGPSKKGFMVT